MSFVAIGIGVGTAAIKVGMGIHQNKLASGINVPEANYTVSPYAKSILEQAQTLQNSEMPGLQQAQNNIAGNQSNAIGSINRNASSGAQALALLAATQGNTNAAFNQLRGQQQNYFMNMLQNLNSANRVMINEGDKVYQSDLRNRQEAIGEKNALRGAATQNIGGGLNDLTNYAFLGDQMGVLGGGKKNNVENPDLSNQPWWKNGL